MRRNVLMVAAALTSVVVALYVIDRSHLSAQSAPTRVAAVPAEKGGQDVFGAYEVVPGWPKKLSTNAGHEGWTFGAGQSVFAESPDRIYVVQRGELPEIPRPQTKKLSDLGPSIAFPIGRLPWRDATTASPPGNGGSGQLAEGGMEAWGRNNKMGVDARWEHCVLVFDGQGNLLPETANWMQWDASLQRPHFIAISPYDADKNVWLIDDHKHVIYKFSHDGKTKLLTIGTYGVPGADATHFNRPTYMDWFPDGSFVVADGYNGTRVAKFDKNGKFLAAWGEKGSNQNDTRPAFFNNVHGIAVDPKTRRVFVNDRGNHRAQVFDENGKYPRLVAVRRSAVGRPHVQHHERRFPLGGRSRHEPDPQVRPQRQLPVFVGHVGRFPRRHVGRARHEHGSGRQLLRGGSGQRRRPEIPAARRRQPGVPRRKTPQGGLEIVSGT